MEVELSLKTLRILLTVGVLFPTTTSKLPAQEQEAPVEYRSSEVKKGSDFAPAEQKVSVREALDYRRPKGVLGKAAHAATRVDLNSLYQRRVQMYDGTTYTDTLAGQRPQDPEVLRRESPPAATGEISRTCKRILVLAIPVLLFGVFLIWWQRQTKFAAAPTSQIVRLRNQPQGRERSQATQVKTARSK